MGLRDVLSVAGEFGGWLVKRGIAQAMNWDQEISRLRRKVASEPDNSDAMMRLRYLEIRAGHEIHEIVDKEQESVLRQGVRPTIDLSGYDGSCFVPGSLVIETIGQIAYPGRDYEFDRMNGVIVWKVEPALDQEFSIKWSQWEPMDEEGQASEAANIFAEEPWE